MRLEKGVVCRLEDGGFGIVGLVTLEVRMDISVVFCLGC